MSKNVYGGPLHPAPRNRGRQGRSSDDNDQEEGNVKCTGKCCQSCTAGVIADCVAVCCCPCALVNILILAFFRLPWTLGKRIFKLHTNNSSNVNKLRKCKGYLIEDEDKEEEDGVSTKGKLEYEEGIPDLVMSSSSSSSSSKLAQMRDELLNNNNNEEEAWIELNQAASLYLGFGRVSSHHSPQEEDLHPPRRLG